MYLCFFSIKFSDKRKSLCNNNTLIYSHVRVTCFSEDNLKLIIIVKISNYFVVLL
jgi:hypothetical protein